MSRIFYALVLVISVLTGLAFAEERTTMVSMVGEYAKIDTASTGKAIDSLQAGGNVANATMKSIQDHPEKFAPIVFYQAAFYLFDQGKNSRKPV